MESFKSILPPPTHITHNREQRQLNIELLRIVAMFLVIMVHSDFYTLGAPDKTTLLTNPLNFCTRIFFQSLSIICVNVFVLISGWFGIKASLKGICNFIFQCLFFAFFINVIGWSMGYVNFSIKMALESVMLYHVNWFILAYICLFIFSPVLNSFAETASKQQFEKILIAFFAFELIWGVSGVAKFIAYGDSATSIIGLYLLARYLKLYGEKIYNHGVLIYIVSLLAVFAGFFVMEYFDIPGGWAAYCNPLVITESIGLFLIFNKLRINHGRKIITFFSQSAFAVFLLHIHSAFMGNVFKSSILYIYDTFSGFKVLALIFLFLVCVFAVAVLMDQPRLWIWRALSRRFFPDTPAAK